MPSPVRSALLVPLLAAVAVALAAPAEARGRLTFTDPAGDANSVNGQQFADTTVPSASAPATVAAADIVSVTLEDLKAGRRVVGLRAVLTLAEAPREGVLYRIKSSTPSCNSLWFEHRRWLQAPPESHVRSACGAPEELAPMTVKAAGKTLVFEVPFTRLPRGAKPGTTMTSISAGTTVLLGQASAFLSAPQLDVAVTTGTFRLG